MAVGLHSSAQFAGILAALMRQLLSDLARGIVLGIDLPQRGLWMSLAVEHTVD